MPLSNKVPDPKRSAAGKLNRAKRQALTPEGAAKLRASALVHRPWQFATGPRTAAGKRKAAANGLAKAAGGQSARAAKREIASLGDMLASMGSVRRALPEASATAAEGDTG